MTMSQRSAARVFQSITFILIISEERSRNAKENAELMNKSEHKQYWQYSSLTGRRTSKSIICLNANCLKPKSRMIFLAHAKKTSGRYLCKQIHADHFASSKFIYAHMLLFEHCRDSYIARGKHIIHQTNVPLHSTS